MSERKPGARGPLSNWPFYDHSQGFFRDGGWVEYPGGILAYAQANGLKVEGTFDERLAVATYHGEMECSETVVVVDSPPLNLANLAPQPFGAHSMQMGLAADSLRSADAMGFEKRKPLGSVAPEYDHWIVAKNDGTD